MVSDTCSNTGAPLKQCVECKKDRFCNVTCQGKAPECDRKECEGREPDFDKAQQEAASGIESQSIFVPEDLNDPNSDLWKPPPPRPECPICLLPLPLGTNESIYMACCGKMVCGGCDMKNCETVEENKIARRANVPLEETCPFCRDAAPLNMEERMERAKKRMEVNDSEAFFFMGGYFLEGFGGPNHELEGFQHLLRASELGNVDAMQCVADFYRTGELVDADETKYKEYLQLSAMGGNLPARHNLGVLEADHGNLGLALRHWRIAADAGLKISLDYIKDAYRQGLVCKDGFASILRAFHASREEVKSEAREKYYAKYLQGEENGL